VTIGSADPARCGAMPVIGDDVFIGAGAKVIGDIHVGDGAFIRRQRGGGAGRPRRQPGGGAGRGRGDAAAGRGFVGKRHPVRHRMVTSTSSPSDGQLSGRITPTKRNR